MRAKVMKVRKAELIIVYKPYGARVIVMQEKKNMSFELTETQLEEIVSIFQEILEEVEKRRMEEVGARETRVRDEGNKMD